MQKYFGKFCQTCPICNLRPVMKNGWSCRKCCDEMSAFTFSQFLINNQSSIFPDLGSLKDKLKK